MHWVLDCSSGCDTWRVLRWLDRSRNRYHQGDRADPIGECRHLPTRRQRGLVAIFRQFLQSDGHFEKIGPRPVFVTQ